MKKEAIKSCWMVTMQYSRMLAFTSLILFPLIYADDSLINYYYYGKGTRRNLPHILYVEDTGHRVHYATIPLWRNKDEKDS